MEEWKFRRSGESGSLRGADPEPLYFQPLLAVLGRGVLFNLRATLGPVSPYVYISTVKVFLLVKNALLERVENHLMNSSRPAGYLLKKFNVRRRVKGFSDLKKTGFPCKCFLWGVEHCVK